LSGRDFADICFDPMINALLLIFAPTPAWDRISRATRSLAYLLLGFLLPLVGAGCLAEGFGLVKWGKWQGTVAHLKKFPVGEAVIFELGHFVLLVGTVFLGAKLLKSIGETFHGRHTFNQAFAAVAYGMTPFFLIRFLDAFRDISPWITWAVGILLSIGILYQGLPRVMEPDPPHAFGLYLMSSLLLILITGLGRFVTAWYLAGKLTRLESWISGVAKSFS
jgi:hypothetical protein